MIMNPLQSNEFFDDPFTMAAKAEAFELGMKWLTRALGDKEPLPGLDHILLNDLKSGGIRDAKEYFNVARGKNMGIENRGGRITPRIN